MRLPRARRLLVAINVMALVFGAGVASGGGAVTQIVRPGNLHDWQVYGQCFASTSCSRTDVVGFTTKNQPPSGKGSLYLATGSDPNSLAGLVDFTQGRKLADLTELSFESKKVNIGPNNVTLGFTFNMTENGSSIPPLAFKREGPSSWIGSEGYPSTVNGNWIESDVDNHVATYPNAVIVSMLIYLVGGISDSAGEAYVDNFHLAFTDPTESDVISNFEPPTLSLPDKIVTEGNVIKTIKIPITLNAANGIPIKISFRTIGATAKVDSDFTKTTGRLTIPEGETSGEIEVKIKGGMRDEPNEHFFVQLTEPLNAKIADGKSKITIRDND